MSLIDTHSAKHFKTLDTKHSNFVFLKVVSICCCVNQLTHLFVFLFWPVKPILPPDLKRCSCKSGYPDRKVHAPKKAFSFSTPIFFHFTLDRTKIEVKQFCERKTKQKSHLQPLLCGHWCKLLFGNLWHTLMLKLVCILK